MYAWSLFARSTGVLSIAARLVFKAEQDALAYRPIG